MFLSHMHSSFLNVKQKCLDNGKMKNKTKIQLQLHIGTCAMTSCDQMSEAEVMCCPFVLSDSEGLRRVGPNTVARLWRDILLMGSFSATLQGTNTNKSSQSGRREGQVLHFCQRQILQNNRQQVEGCGCTCG